MDTVTVVCTQCRVIIRFGKDKIGMRGKCLRCGTPFIVGGAAPAVPKANVEMKPTVLPVPAMAQPIVLPTSIVMPPAARTSTVIDRYPFLKKAWFWVVAVWLGLTVLSCTGLLTMVFLFSESSSTKLARAEKYVQSAKEAYAEKRPEEAMDLLGKAWFDTSFKTPLRDEVDALKIRYAKEIVAGMIADAQKARMAGDKMGAIAQLKKTEPYYFAPNQAEAKSLLEQLDPPQPPTAPHSGPKITPPVNSSTPTPLAVSKKSEMGISLQQLRNKYPLLAQHRFEETRNKAGNTLYVWSIKSSDDRTLASLNVTEVQVKAVGPQENLTLVQVHCLYKSGNATTRASAGLLGLRVVNIITGEEMTDLVNWFTSNPSGTSKIIRGNKVLFSHLVMGEIGDVSFLITPASE